MKNKKLTEEEKEVANLYALEKWPDETVTVEEQSQAGQAVFHIG